MFVLLLKLLEVRKMQFNLWCIWCDHIQSFFGLLGRHCTTHDKWDIEICFQEFLISLGRPLKFLCLYALIDSAKTEGRPLKKRRFNFFFIFLVFL